MGMGVFMKKRIENICMAVLFLLMTFVVLYMAGCVHFWFMLHDKGGVL
jgi:hypothetical protein